MQDLKAKIGFEALEKLLYISNNKSDAIPTTPEEFEDFLISAFKNLLKKIYFLSPEVTECFEFEFETPEGLVELKTIKDCFNGIVKKFFTIEDLKTAMKKVILPEGEIPKILLGKEYDFMVIKNTETINLQICLGEIEGIDFIYLPTEFYLSLNKFNLLEPILLNKILKFVKFQNGRVFTLEDFFQLTKPNITFAYQFIFFVISSISGLKKKMDFLIQNDILQIMKDAKNVGLSDFWILKVIEEKEKNEILESFLKENKLQSFLMRFFELVKIELGIESLKFKLNYLIVLLKYNKALFIEKKIYEKE